MTEATLKGALCKLLRQAIPGGRVFRHEDAFTGGIPDISISDKGRTLWVEVKFDRPGRPGKLTALQHASLVALKGVVLRYQVDKDGLLRASIQNGDEVFREWYTPKLKNKAAVHRIVAESLLRMLEVS